VLKSSGRNQTSGACGTQTRSSSGSARTAISGRMPSAAVIIGAPLTGLPAALMRCR
jgi:hypothetical protein